MSELETKTRYDAAEAEPRILRRWLESGLFHPEPEGTADENYSIAVPPPNVTGALHMGHALNGSIQDALIRFNRARGKRAKWILGTDHAGIATQKQVEKQLRGEGAAARRSGARPSPSASGSGASSTATRSSGSSSGSAPRSTTTTSASRSTSATSRRS